MTDTEKKPPILRFLTARFIEDENELDNDERHWSEVPSATFGHQRLSDELAAKRAALKSLTIMCQYEWSGQYAVRDTARHVVEALAEVYSEHPDYPPLHLAWGTWGQKS